MITANDLIKKLELEPHVEGGYFKRIYESKEKISLASNSEKKRHLGTSIYFLLEGDGFSAFHRLKSDEIWSFNYGSSLTIYVINEKGRLNKIILGDTSNPIYQVTIHANQWFAAEVNDKSSFTLLSCFVCPGFEYDDFELAERKTLSSQYPDHSGIIKRFTF